MDTLTLNSIISFKIKIIEKQRTSKLQQKVLKLKGICVRWSSPKTDLETNFLNLEN